MPKRYTKAELLEKLKMWAKNNNKNPSSIDIDEDVTMPSIGTYIRHFGSFNKAKQILGFKVNKCKCEVIYNKEILMEKLKLWVKTHEKNPTSRDITNDPTMPSLKAYINHFGSFNEAKIIAGLEINENFAKITYTKEDLIKKLIEWKECHGKSPSTNDIDSDESMPSVRTFRNHFGSFNNAKCEAGLEIYIHDSELNHLDSIPILNEWQNGRKGELEDTTITGYLRVLLRFDKFLKENNKSLSNMNFVDIKNYTFKIREIYAKSSMEQEFNAIMNFLNFFYRKAKIEKKIAKSPFDESTLIITESFFQKQFKKMEDDRNVEPALTREEVNKIKKKLKQYPLLDVMFRLDLNLGLRASEFAKIKINEGKINSRNEARDNDVWIDLSSGILMIYRRKVRRPHLVALTKKMILLVKKQLMLRKHYDVAHNFLFFSKQGKQLRSHLIYIYYQEISDLVGFRVTSHRVRRTMATMLDEAGVPHAIIRNRMGHSPRDITEKYKHYSIKKQVEILEEKVGIL